MVECQAGNVWRKTQDSLKTKLNMLEYAWVSDLCCIELGETEITLAAPSKFHAEKAAKGFLAHIADALSEVTGRDYSITIKIDPEAAKTAAAARHNEEKEAPQLTQTPVVKNVPQEKNLKKTLGQPLSQNYTFENYIIGDNNRFAVNAALAVSRNPGLSYNPLLIYGGVGLGKTHLMQAVGNVLAERENFKVIYTTAESFTNEFIDCFGSAVQSGRSKMTAFKNKYRHADALLIDDIHFFTKKSSTQEELFHTFNALYDSNKHIIFTCDRPVSELKDIESRIVNRLTRGLVVDLQPPDYETKCAIIRAKLKSMHAEIPEDVVDFISNNVQTNVRDLEGAVTKLAAYAKLVHEKITLEIAQEQLLSDLNAYRYSPNVTMDIIVRIVAGNFGLLPNDIKSKNRAQRTTYPRQLAMYIARQITEFTTTEIGEYFGGKDHGTVIHACKKIAQRLMEVPNETTLIQSLVREIKEAVR